MNGKIETRGKDKIVFLVNSSATKTYKFTVKKIEVENDSIERYRTEIKQLSPGDEILLGYTNSFSKLEYPRYKKEVFKTLNPLTDIKEEDFKTELDSKMRDFYKKIANKHKEKLKYISKNFPDTIINGQKLKYWFETEYFYDSLHPLPRNYFKYIYQVTGEVETK